MPVTIYPSANTSEPCRLNDLLRNASPNKVLRGAVSLKLRHGQRDPITKLNKIWASSFEDEEHIDVYASANGFVHSAIRAYNAHHHLRIRPDDVWMAIICQLSIYVNKNAEALRSIFVSHSGKIPLNVKGGYHHGFNQFADTITEVLSEAVKDPTIPPWIMQEFSTTTPTDRIAAAMVMMANFQAYFKYYDPTDCGLPSVTLLGEQADWTQLLSAIDRLSTLVPEGSSFASSSKSSSGKASMDSPAAQMATWISLLEPVLLRFVRSFEEPTSQNTINFWQQIADYRVGGSGADYLSGWLTAFCFWNEEGNCNYGSRFQLVLDEVHYSSLDWDDVPPGWASVPLEVDFDESPPRVHKCRMLAGSIGITPFLAHIAGQDVPGNNAVGADNTIGKDFATTASKGTPKQSEQLETRSWPRRMLRALLSCCGSGDTINQHEVRRPSTATNKQKQPEHRETGKSKRSPAYPIPGEVVELPPYPGPLPAKISSGHEATDRMHAHGVHDYEGTNRPWPKVENPPAYRLDGLQPRIGWFMWEEEVVPGRAPLPDDV